LLFAIAHALDSVRQGSVDDESLAFSANKIVRRCLDKRAIRYKDYKIWRKLNPLVFTTVVDKENQLIGFFDIFPLKPGAGDEMIAGRLTEHSLKIDHILALADAPSAAHLHIATILVNPGQRAFTSLVARKVLLLKMREFLDEHYAPIEGRTYTAYAQSRAGEALLKRCGFLMTIPAKESEQKSSLYVLRPAGTAAAFSRFDRADECFSRRSRLADLDSRIQKIELQLRALIASLLNPAQLPTDVMQKVNERMLQAAKKDVARGADYYKTLPTLLEFFDLRELERTITNRALWPKFEARFATKEALIAKFAPLAELRNAIRHSRSMDEIMRMEGEAAIIWFERVLKK
jgi:hypothetical protein